MGEKNQLVEMVGVKIQYCRRKLNQLLHLKTKDLVCRNMKLRKRLENMLNNNNQKYADTIFLVNGSIFRTSSHLVSVHSDVLCDLIGEHFEHCGDREIRIAAVKHDMSFLYFLHYMHDFDISFTSLDMEVLCEILYLCSRYQVMDFFIDLKSFIADIKDFHVDTVVVLLNTALKYDINELYKELLVFAFRNAEKLVKHESFEELNYITLTELLQSDWLDAKEIDIFSATLEWHKMNINLDKLVEDYLCECENPEDEGITIEEALATDHENSDAESCATSTRCVVNGHSVVKHLIDLCIIPQATHTAGARLAERFVIVENFSENTLKTLLRHIRLGMIPTDEYRKILEAYDEEPYRRVLRGDYFSNSTQPRYFCTEYRRFQAFVVENSKKYLNIRPLLTNSLSWPLKPRSAYSLINLLPPSVSVLSIFFSRLGLPYLFQLGIIFKLIKTLETVIDF